MLPLIRWQLPATAACYYRPLRDGDIVNIDVTCYLAGYHGDTSRTFYVGTPSPSAKRLVEANEEALREAIKVRQQPCACLIMAQPVLLEGAHLRCWKCMPDCMCCRAHTHTIHHNTVATMLPCSATCAWLVWLGSYIISVAELLYLALCRSVPQVYP